MVERGEVEEGILSAIILHFFQLEGRRRIVRKRMVGEKSRLMGSKKAKGGEGGKAGEDDAKSCRDDQMLHHRSSTAK
jgi:hypothetical protein